MELGRDVLLSGFVVINKWHLLSSFSQDRNKRKYLTIIPYHTFSISSFISNLLNVITANIVIILYNKTADF